MRVALGGAAVFLADVYFANRYISGFELGWTVVGLVGVLVGASNIRDSIRDLASLAAAAHGNEDDADIAVSHLRADVVRISELVAVITIGVLAMTVPTPNPAPPVTPLGWVFIIALYWIEIGLTLNTVLDRRLRRRLLARRDPSSSGT